MFRLSSHLKKDINKIDKIQRGYFLSYYLGTFIISPERNKSYKDRLVDLRLHSLETRRLWGELIKGLKFLMVLII